MKDTPGTVRRALWYSTVSCEPPDQTFTPKPSPALPDWSLLTALAGKSVPSARRAGQTHASSVKASGEAFRAGIVPART